MPVPHELPVGPVPQPRFPEKLKGFWHVLPALRGLVHEAEPRRVRGPDPPERPAGAARSREVPGGGQPPEHQPQD